MHKNQLASIFGILFLFFTQTGKALQRKECFKNEYINKTIISSPSYFHNDSIHHLNFRYSDRQRGIKPYIAPTLLISGGTALHFMTGAKKNFRDYVQQHFAYTGQLDDYLRYAPLAAVYSLNLLGIEGKNNFGNRTAIAVKSILLNGFLVSSLKSWTKVKRPSGGLHSFPSGHASVAFAMAQFMHHEYGELSPWYSIGAYSTATAVAALRVAKDVHWISDVVAGAGIGMLSTEFVYLTHLYKWDNEHLKRLDIFPFQIGKQKGITLTYTF